MPRAVIKRYWTIKQLTSRTRHWARALKGFLLIAYAHQHGRGLARMCCAWQTACFLTCQHPCCASHRWRSCLLMRMASPPQHLWLGNQGIVIKFSPGFQYFSKKIISMRYWSITNINVGYWTITISKTCYNTNNIKKILKLPITELSTYNLINSQSYYCTTNSSSCHIMILPSP